ncbi:hypothetical protein CVT24_000079 [Panaeolus cyanescens]|uniref:Uncharacterized protein n=1 Tax=Panaeolus cyanescens TaxID=181874 RepID=A0A409X2K1_9AGAR|nr:hypothetical protein CVT24_000079 [Panaeolus cyanescens]
MPTSSGRRGIYSALTTLANDPSYAANFFGSEYTGVGETFTIEECPSSAHFLEPRFFPAVVNDDRASVYSTLLIGEIDIGMGTRIGAKGNWKSGCRHFDTLITNRTACQNAYAFRAPSGANDELSDIYYGQLAEFDAVGTAVRDLTGAYDVQTPLIGNPPSPWTYEGFATLGVPIYKSSRLNANLAYHHLADAFPLNLDRSWQKNCDLFIQLRKGAYWATEQELAMTYPCSCLPDYDCRSFAHEDVGVRQPEIYDQNNRLVPPWDLHSVLCQGTLTLMEGTLKIRRTSDMHPIVNFLAQSITVLDGPLPFDFDAETHSESANDSDTTSEDDATTDMATDGGSD